MSVSFAQINNIEGLTEVQEAHVQIISVVCKLSYRVKCTEKARKTRAPSHEAMLSAMQLVLSI